jgi:hypothetical protein
VCSKVILADGALVAQFPSPAARLRSRIPLFLQMRQELMVVQFTFEMKPSSQLIAARSKVVKQTLEVGLFVLPTLLFQSRIQISIAMSPRWEVASISTIVLKNPQRYY